MSATPHHAQLVKKLIAICALMFAFGFALVPLYDVFCRYTGINGKTAQTAAAASTKVDSSRTIRIEFIATSNQAANLRFAPEISSLNLHPGETLLMNFSAENLTNKALVAQAVPSVSPGQYAQYFKKIECFCFTQQPLAAHEAKLMPVQFYVDRDLPPEVTTITLSYRMYQVQALSGQAL